MASAASEPRIDIPFLLWARLILALRRRGRGVRESGAFLLAPKESQRNRVSTYICYDDLDPNALQGGAIAFHDVGYAALWQLCRERKLKIVADIHTHGGRGVGQSSIDQRNPMMPTAGHTALIAPNFAQAGCWSLKNVGVYEHLSDLKWRTCALGERVRLTMW